MKPKISCIYKITCKVNNRVYIGQTINFYDRINHHKNKLSRNCDDNPYLQADYNKYHPSDFTFEILEECTIDNLLERETYYINKFGGKDNDSLYNVQDINGFNIQYCKSRRQEGNAMYGKTHSDEVKLLLHNINKGKHLSQEHKDKISQGLKNSTCHSFENNQKRRAASTKYDNLFIDKLRKEYKEVKNYRILGSKYNIHPNIISQLIRYGTTSKSVINKIKKKN